MSVIVERDNIGIFGKMNSGKSSLVNLLSQQEASIVDETPGTTADTRVINQELHGMGPVSFYDTAGINEAGGLGGKKKKKGLKLLKECDLILLVVDPSSAELNSEKELASLIDGQQKEALIIYNLFRPEDRELINKLEEKNRFLKKYKNIKINVLESRNRQDLLNFLISNFKSKNQKTRLLPFLQKNSFYVMVIPMDQETPPGRFLRPQAMTEEYITRNWAYPSSFRLDLSAADSRDTIIKNKEKERFKKFISSFREKPAGVITDSQAAGVVHRWLDKDIPLTTFSMIMINYFSRGNLVRFVCGLRALEGLKKGDSVLVAEACNHSRIAEDIGTVKIPRFIENSLPGVKIEFSFGREFGEALELTHYSLVIHCGGCMISSQKLQARLQVLDSAGVPYTNYGLFLAYMKGLAVLDRVLEPWKIKY